MAQVVSHFLYTERTETLNDNINGSAPEASMYHVYRAPNTNLVKLNQIFCEYMEAVKNKTFYLCGDFNINLINYEQNQETNIFMNNLFTFGMYPLINRPSRITKTSATLIDNIFSNDIKTCVTSGLLISDISDHLPVFCCHNNSLSCYNTETVKGNREMRLVNDRNLYNLNLSLADCFETLYQSDDVNEAYTIFLKVFLKEYNEICPMVKCFRKIFFIHAFLIDLVIQGLSLYKKKFFV